MLTATFVMGVLAGCATCPPPDDDYHITIIYAADRAGDGCPSTVRWDGRATPVQVGAEHFDPEHLRVLLPLGTVAPVRELIEIYDGAARLEVSGVFRANRFTCGEGCFFDVVDYDLSALPDGEYQVVHRLASAPAGLRSTEGPATTFEGEPALVTTIVLARDDDAR